VCRYSCGTDCRSDAGAGFSGSSFASARQSAVVHPPILNSITLASKLDRFLVDLPLDEWAGQISAGSQADVAETRDFLLTYVNEMRVSFRLIETEIAKEQRILEVGSGLCLLSFFLNKEGYHIVALEPALGGFELFDAAKKVIAGHFSSIPLQILECTAQQLDPAVHGHFDLIFSNNVLEHIPAWEDALLAMGGVLQASGHMTHACPNYSVPYEPHYGVPVFRRFPALSKRLFLPANADEGIWQSLNFITCRQVGAFCARHTLRCRFKQGLLFDALQRIDTDPLFQQRHKGFIASAARLVMRCGLGRLVRRIPASMATPMVMQLSKAASGGC